MNILCKIEHRLPRDCIAWENGNCNLDLPHDGIVRQRSLGARNTKVSTDSVCGLLPHSLFRFARANKNIYISTHE